MAERGRIVNGGLGTNDLAQISEATDKRSGRASDPRQHSGSSARRSSRRFSGLGYRRHCKNRKEGAFSLPDGWNEKLGQPVPMCPVAISGMNGVPNANSVKI
jgi:hypothetical protein